MKEGWNFMVSERTDSMIATYMKWTNRKVLTPEEFLLFRKQAIEEELAGVEDDYMAGSRQKPDTMTSAVETIPEKRREVKPKPKRKPAPVKREAEIIQETVPKENKDSVSKEDTNKFGMSDQDFLAFMQSVED